MMPSSSIAAKRFSGSFRSIPVIPAARHSRYRKVSGCTSSEVEALRTFPTLSSKAVSVSIRAVPFSWSVGAQLLDQSVEKAALVVQQIPEFQQQCIDLDFGVPGDTSSGALAEHSQRPVGVVSRPRQVSGAGRIGGATDAENHTCQPVRGPVQEGPAQPTAPSRGDRRRPVRNPGRSRSTRRRPGLPRIPGRG